MGLMLSCHQPVPIPQASLGRGQEREEAQRASSLTPGRAQQGWEIRTFLSREPGDNSLLPSMGLVTPASLSPRSPDWAQGSGVGERDREVPGAVVSILGAPKAHGVLSDPGLASAGAEVTQQVEGHPPASTGHIWLGR